MYQYTDFDRRFIRARAAQYRGGGLDQRVDGRARTLLRGLLSRVDDGCAGHGVPRMRVDIVSNCSDYRSQRSEAEHPGIQEMAMNKTLRPARDFTPAVPVLGAYDPIVSLFTRERHWRSSFLR